MASLKNALYHSPVRPSLVIYERYAGMKAAYESGAGTAPDQRKPGTKRTCTI